MIVIELGIGLIVVVVEMRFEYVGFGGGETILGELEVVNQFWVNKFWVFKGAYNNSRASRGEAMGEEKE